MKMKMKMKMPDNTELTGDKRGANHELWERITEMTRDQIQGLKRTLKERSSAAKLVVSNSNSNSNSNKRASS
jgi:hypothetical protein